MQKKKKKNEKLLLVYVCLNINCSGVGGWSYMWVFVASVCGLNIFQT